VCAPYLPPAKKGPTTPSRQCQGCKKHVRGNNFEAGRITEDSLWNCARCLHEKTRTQCVECGGVCAITLPRCYNCWDAAREKHLDRQGRCEGTTLAGRRCSLTRASQHWEAAPLWHGGRFCSSHMAYDDPPIMCAASTKEFPFSPCKVHSRLSYDEAAPLRDGSLFCDHHRQKCAGWTANGHECRLSSSSTHVHAEPLKRGEQFCAHHWKCCEGCGSTWMDPCECAACEEQPPCEGCGSLRLPCDCAVDAATCCEGCGEVACYCGY
jgi:hypothetical protein